MGAPAGPAPTPVPTSKQCSAMLAADRASGAPLRFEQAAVEEARDRYLAQTEIGRYVIAVFYNNQKRLEERANGLDARGEDKALAQALYGRYVGDAKLALANPDRTDVRLTERQMADAEAALVVWRRYLSDDEWRAADALAELVRAKVSVGMTARDGLELLDDEGLLRQVKAIASKVSFLDTNV